MTTRCLRVTFLFARIFPILLSLIATNVETSPSPSFQVFRIVPDTKEQLKVLKDLVDNADVYDLDFWKSPTKTGVSTDVMIPSTTLKNITDLLSSSNISYVVSVPDVVRLMKEYETPKDSGISDLLRSFYRRFKDDGVATNKATYNFDDYGSYSDMVNWMTKIQEYYPSFTKVIQIGTTHEGRSIVGIKIGNHISNQNKRVVWIDGGIHAREWASIHTALYFINELVGKYGSDPDITHYVNSLNFYIIPCVNPDGYVYAFAAKDNPRQRLWRKNRSKPVCPSGLSAGQNPAEKCCQGVDLNRNFGFHWAEPGSNSNPCSLIYQGHSAFSEPETRAVRDMLLSPELYGKVDAFITMHTYSQLWIYPWGHHENSYPADIVDLKTVAENAVRALESTYGTKYKSGTGADILYAVTGASSDWAKQEAKVKYAYVLELRPAAALNGFVLNTRELVPTAKETWAGIRVVIDAVLKLNNLPAKG
uniref:Peptidase M14 carboxypeptidase A domain-containing protein n=1 Tax=Plectus sambesii TaxID=2011161 RepID=A0A914UYZ3_9BILA